jgi:hypothetical protein
MELFQIVSEPYVDYEAFIALVVAGYFDFWCCRRGGEQVCCVATVGEEVPPSIIWSGWKGVHEIWFGVMW